MTKVTPIEFATVQLEEAVEQHVDKKNYLVAITLSGAAEEVFGKMLKEENRALHELKNRLRTMLPDLEDTDKDIINFINCPKNTLKHGGADLEKDDLEKHSLTMLARALGNYRAVGETLSPNMERGMCAVLSFLKT